MPYTSTAIAAAHASTCTSGAGAVSRFATSASITSPCETGATGRTGHSSSARWPGLVRAGTSAASQRFQPGSRTAG